MIAAFARPFFHVDPVRAAAADAGAREVVILLDRSASMGYGDHWKRAQDEARKVVTACGGDDHGHARAVRHAAPRRPCAPPTSKAQLEAAIDAAKVAPRRRASRPALRLAQSLLTRSALPRKEAVLISDFQKAGWERQEEIQLPEGATLTPISVADAETADLSVGIGRRSSARRSRARSASASRRA